MGTYLSSYAVDLDKLAAVFASHDQRLLKRVTADKERIAHNTDWFAKQIAAGAPTLEFAIAEVIAGKITRAKTTVVAHAKARGKTTPKKKASTSVDHSFQYVYALERICDVVGTAVGDELKIGGWIEETLDPLLKKVKARDFCRMMGLHGKPKPPIPIPTPKDYPFCSSLSPAEVIAARDAFVRLEKHVRTATAKEVTDDQRELLEFVIPEMKSRLVPTAKKSRGMVVFLY